MLKSSDTQILVSWGGTVTCGSLSWRTRSGDHYLKQKEGFSNTDSLGSYLHVFCLGRNFQSY